MRTTSRKLLIGLLAIGMSFPGVCQDSKSYVSLNGVDVAKPKQPIEIWIHLEPPNQSRVTVTLIGDISMKNRRIEIQPREQKTLQVLPEPGPEAIAWIGAEANGYKSAWITVNVGFDGVLKFSSTGPLEYNNPTSLTLQVMHSDGKPFALRGDVDLVLQASGGYIYDPKKNSKNKWVEEMGLPFPRGSHKSSQFQVKPRYWRGGPVHLSATLSSGNNTLQQEDINLDSVPAWWFLLALSIGGGLLHGVYAVISAPHLRKRTVAAIATALFSSAIAGTLGFLLANHDILGLKLDPNVLRTYPLLGFLFSYLGLSLLLSKFQPGTGVRK